jgi:hypothetical protein
LVRGLPFQRTTELLTKFVPVMTRVNPPLPATAVAGLMLLIVGAGLLMVNVAVLDVAAARSGVEDRHIRRPGGRNIAGGDGGGQLGAGDEGRAYGRLPFQRTTELVTKFVPVMTRVNPPLPATRCRWTDAADRRRRIIDGERHRARLAAAGGRG